jgi:uncharacterized membrane protein HdeD (DUF308 family)
MPAAGRWIGCSAADGDGRLLAIPSTWGWLLASGPADLALAAIIIAGWPGTTAWVLGLLFGVNLLTTGWAVVMVALGARDIARSVTAPISER